MTGNVFYVENSLKNNICLPLMQYHILYYICISQKGASICISHANLPSSVISGFQKYLFYGHSNEFRKDKFWKIHNNQNNFMQFILSINLRNYYFQLYVKAFGAVSDDDARKSCSSRVHRSCSPWRSCRQSDQEEPAVKKCELKLSRRWALSKDRL